MAPLPDADRDKNDRDPQQDALNDDMIINPIEEIPESSKRRGPRDSESLQAVDEVMKSPTGVIEVSGETTEEIVRFYKSMIQWMRRHGKEYSGLEVHKDGNLVYLVWNDGVAKARDAVIEPSPEPTPWLGNEYGANAVPDLEEPSPDGWRNLSENLVYRPIEALPASSSRRGPRSSICFDAVQKLLESPTRKLSLRGKDLASTERFYKSMIQWLVRHKSSYPTLRLRKDGDLLFLWLEEDQAAA